MSKLIFVDTNIFLDFYRIRGRQSDLSILKHIDENHGLIITGSQVEMEFKKNRPPVVLEFYQILKKLNQDRPKLPTYLASSRQSSGLESGHKKLEAQLITLRKRISNVFSHPARHDPVYRTAQRLFRDQTPYNLSRNKKERLTIRRLASKRFLLGYPPRKPGDTSFGDAINWEWIIYCAKKSGFDIVIVSRDSDYGLQSDNRMYLNEWLEQEFRERVSKKRKIFLTDHLTGGFKLASIKVAKKEEDAEAQFLAERAKGISASGFAASLIPSASIVDTIRGMTGLAASVIPSVSLVDSIRGMTQNQLSQILNLGQTSAFFEWVKQNFPTKDDVEKKDKS